MTTNQQLAQQAAEKIDNEISSAVGESLRPNITQIATIIATTYEPVLKKRDEVIDEAIVILNTAEQWTEKDL